LHWPSFFWSRECFCFCPLFPPLSLSSLDGIGRIIKHWYYLPRIECNYNFLCGELSNLCPLLILYISL
jgi:hypothetical protein